ncbi:hypothetical protein TBK1r_39040 [Stieleria magnilauensis]|uniref:Uncharacterized protein n=1 Tax=Stieleria magnilauensis TaxID=2527963 RepID=A0ABX5XSH8_9BACT|nr:hypothetical protein TBK1r_39040 [Planctomycetes bacterium TBK1r]
MHVPITFMLSSRRTDTRAEPCVINSRRMPHENSGSCQRSSGIGRSGLSEAIKSASTPKQVWNKPSATSKKPKTKNIATSPNLRKLTASRPHQFRNTISRKGASPGSASPHNVTKTKPDLAVLHVSRMNYRHSRRIDHLGAKAKRNKTPRYSTAIQIPSHPSRQQNKPQVATTQCDHQGYSLEAQRLSLDGPLLPQPL